jgi:GTPase
MIIHMDTFFPKQPPEKEEGNKEYKRYLFWNNRDKNISEIEFINRRASQMLYRLLEGEGKAVYLIGVDDDGRVKSLNDKSIQETIKYVKIISKEIDANVRVIRIYKNNVCTIRLQLEENVLETKLQNLELY